jgi:hypothetical protein
MNYQNRTICIIILAIIVFIFIYYNQTIFHEGLDVTANQPSPSESHSYIENKETTGTMTHTTTTGILDGVSSQITQCQDIINEINIILPRRFEDITIGTVNQTDNLDQVEITIKQGIIQTLDPLLPPPKKGDKPILSNSATWQINAILPRGKKGPIGNKGPKGNIGVPGSIGSVGPIGTMGPWGKDCSNNKCN